MTRFEYRLGRTGHVPSGKPLADSMTIREAVESDAEQLASLMLDAYIGTIDYEGENLDDARHEIRRYLDGEAYLTASRVIESDSVIQAALLLGPMTDVPVVGYVMTRAAMKSQGLGSVLLDECAAAIWAAGHDELRAFITSGNVPSERIFTRAGFAVVAD